MAEQSASKNSSRSRIHGRDALDDLPAGGLLVAGAVAAAAAVAWAALVVGLGAFVAARVMGTRWLPTAALGLAGAVALGVVGPREALEGFVSEGPVWRAMEGGVGAWTGAVAPVALLGGGVVAAALEVWWQVSRPFWTQRTTRRSLGARVRARRDRRAMRAGRAHGPDGVALGVDERGELVRLGAGELGHHALVVGATGAGKTTTLLTLCHGLLPSFQAQWASTRGGLVVVDLKGDPALVRALRDLAQRHDRAARVWTFTGPDTWNPLATGDATELTDKLVGLEEWSEPHYKRGAQRYLQAVLSALITLGARRDLARVVELLNVEAFSALVDREAGRGLPEGEAERLRSYLGALDKSAHSAVVGLANRLALLSESRAGALLGTGEPERHAIDLAASLEAGDVVVFSLDSQKYGETAAQLAAMVAQDLKTVAAGRLAAMDGGQPVAPAFVVFDEFSAVRSDQLLALMARARGAGLGIVLATQELADLSRVDPGFCDQVLGNTNVKIVHRQDVPESAERLAGVAGTQRGWQETFQTERGRLTRLGGQVVGGWHGSNTGVGTIREVESYVVHPNVLKALGQGEAVLMRKHPAVDVRRVHVAAPAAAHAEAASRRQDPLLGSPDLPSSAPAATAIAPGPAPRS